MGRREDLTRENGVSPGPDDNTPVGNPKDFVPRTDAGARKLIDRLDRLQLRLVALKSSTVRYDRFIAMIGVSATVIVSAAWKVQADNLRAMERVHLAEMAALRDDIHGELQRANAYAAGNYRVVVEKQAPAVVAQEVRAAIADAGTLR
jgi:hypothetical protein